MITSKDTSFIVTMFLTVAFGAGLGISQLDNPNPNPNIYTIFGFLFMIVGNLGIYAMCIAKDKETLARLKLQKELKTQAKLKLQKELREAEMWSALSVDESAAAKHKYN